MDTHTDRRYRFLYKPLLFLACGVPLAWVLADVANLTLNVHLPVPGLGADPVRRMLGIFGHSALNLLLVTLCVSPLRQLSGNAQLLRFRRMLGVWAFTYALLHFLTYVGPFQGFSWSAIARDLVKRPYITIGFAALLMLLALAITSTNGWMRRLRRRWQSLHRLVYACIVLGVWHYWWQVKKDIREPLVYAALAAVLLGWRLWRWRRTAARAAPRVAAPATSNSALPTAPERT
ncbi:MAG TPA: protein-methionine-sulfoxide reductase heme-binding subunit MsrQ [Steroidobacteraceae bacterium]|nr:protein-methionine-sulfoxide reductase heme-binding subunit MsrQ [Steroidobacteraceae bacterium]